MESIKHGAAATAPAKTNSANIVPPIPKLGKLASLLSLFASDLRHHFTCEHLERAKCIVGGVGA
jgi:hypothetical protein